MVCESSSRREMFKSHPCARQQTPLVSPTLKNTNPTKSARVKRANKRGTSKEGQTKAVEREMQVFGQSCCCWVKPRGGSDIITSMHDPSRSRTVSKRLSIRTDRAEAKLA